MRNRRGLRVRIFNEYLNLPDGVVEGTLLKTLRACLTGCRKVKDDYGIRTCAGPGNDEFPRNSL